jgi:hypothetical protein
MFPHNRALAMVYPSNLQSTITSQPPVPRTIIMDRHSTKKRKQKKTLSQDEEGHGKVCSDKISVSELAKVYDDVGLFKPIALLYMQANRPDIAVETCGSVGA